MQMRQAGRELQWPDQMIDIQELCNTIRDGLDDSNFPYEAPLSFIYDYVDGSLMFYVRASRAVWKLIYMIDLPALSGELQHLPHAMHVYAPA